MKKLPRYENERPTEAVHGDAIQTLRLQVYAYRIMFFALFKHLESKGYLNREEFARFLTKEEGQLRRKLGFDKVDKYSMHPMFGYEMWNTLLDELEPDFLTGLLAELPPLTDTTEGLKPPGGL